MPASTANKLHEFSLGLSVLICKMGRLDLVLSTGRFWLQDSMVRLLSRGWRVRMPGFLSRHCWLGSGKGCGTENKIKHSGHREKTL